jgi:thiol-disulfide isomerase/thioredoxin
MRVLPCMLLLACLCTTSTGCSLFKKNTNSTGGGGAGNVAPPKFPDPLLNSNIPQPPTFPTNPPAAGTNTPPTLPTSGGSSMLAGTVVDAYHRPIGNVYVRWINLEEKEKDGAPIDVAANAHGHFIIQGLKPGTSYKLIARTKQGDKMLAGTALTTAPNVRVVIPISEDRVNSSTPPLPSAPAVPAAAEGVSKNNGNRAPSDPLLGQGKPTGEPNLPATMAVPTAPTNTQTGNPAFIPGVVEVPKDRLPMLNIPNPPAKPMPPAPGDGKLDTGPTRVPSCVIVGSRLENLALRDSKGQTWEYRKHGLGKLVLLDFWRIACPPCRESIPALSKLHQQFGTRGLQVVGIALETGMDERRDAEAVNKFCASMQVGYRQVMGRVGTFDAGQHFKIDGVPTIVLLSEQGDILFHHVGLLDRATLQTLERMIENRLQPRPF